MNLEKVARPAKSPTKGSGVRAAGERQAAPVVREWVTLACAFCRGTGRDPFGLLSVLSDCQVCGGSGWRSLRLPAAPCWFCRETGVHPFSRLTCTTCGSLGSVQVLVGAVVCPGCGGSGREADYQYSDSVLSCRRCGGRGLVAPPPYVPAMQAR